MAGLFKIVVTSSTPLSPNNPMVNVFGYRSNLAVVDEETVLNTEFTTQMLPELQKINNTTTRVNRIEVYNVTNGTGYRDNFLVGSQLGLRTGAPLSVFVTYGFQLNRLTAGKRNGFKRLFTPTEGDVDAEVPSAAMLVVLNAFALKLQAPIKIGIIDTWFPEILERKPPGVYPWTSHGILSATFKRLTTQNSRKR